MTGLITVGEFQLLVGLVMKSGLVLGLSAAGLRGVRRAGVLDPRPVLAATLIGLLLLPWLHFSLPALHLPVLEVPSHDFLISTGTHARTFDVAPSVLAAAVWVYLTGIGAAAIWIGLGYVTAHRLRRTSRTVRAPGVLRGLDRAARDVGYNRRVALRVSPRVPGPSAIGGSHPVILLPAEMLRWPIRELKPVLLHELMHLKRRDLGWRSLAQWVCCLNWINPLAHVVYRAFVQHQEVACDGAVLAHGIRPSDYAAVLLRSAAGSSGRLPGPLAGLRGSGTVKARVIGVLRPRPPVRRARRRTTPFLILLPLVFLIGVTDPWVRESEPGGRIAFVHRPERGRGPMVEEAHGNQLIYLQRKGQRWWEVEDPPPLWELRSRLPDLTK